MSAEKPKPTPRTDEEFAFAPEPARTVERRLRDRSNDVKSSTAEKGSGRVKFDDRGNAIWEWSISTGAYARDVSTDRLHKLENASLAIQDDVPTPAGLAARSNPAAAKKGYDPYDSSRQGKSPPPVNKRKDLRRLGEWLKSQKQGSQNKKP